MKIHGLTNTNPQIQEKMSFFADYFSFTNEYLGKLPHLPYENVCSLIDKILSQLENNRLRCIPYLENYFQQLAVFYDHTFIEKIEAYRKIDHHKNELKKCKSDSITKEDEKSPKLKWIEEHYSILKEDLECLKQDCSQDFDKTIEFAYSLICCSHPLKKHKEELKYAIHLLVSELRLNQHSQESVSKYMDRLLKWKDIPLPEQILEMKESDEKEQKIVEYNTERTFQKQLYGLKNLFKAAEYQIGYFFYFIRDVQIDKQTAESFEVKFDQVTFIWSLHPKLSELREFILDRYKELPTDFYTGYFDETILIAYLKLNYEDVDAARKRGEIIAKKELLQLNQYLHTELILQENRSIFSIDMKSSVKSVQFGSTPKSNRIEKENIDSAKENAFEIFRATESQSKDTILQHESTFLKAFTSDDISQYWVYLENLFWNSSYSKPDEVIKRITRILVNQLLLKKQNLLISLAYLLYDFTTPRSKIGISEEEAESFYKEVVINQNFGVDLTSLRKNITNEFLKDLLNYISEFQSQKEIQNWRKFYFSILRELYEFRNAHLHTGQISKKSELKLSAIIVSLINKIRWGLINSSEQYPELNFDQLIKYLSTPTLN